MYIRDIFIGEKYKIYGDNVNIKSLSIHSDDIGEGCLFIAHNGENFLGRNNVLSAVKNGCRAVLTDDWDVVSWLTGRITVVYTENTRLAESLAADRLYPISDNTKIIGVTGTNGKTSVCHIGKKVFSALGIKCCYTGTLGTDIEGFDGLINNTTPPPSLYRKIVNKAEAEGVKYIFSEVSSQGILQERVSHVPYHALVFTNLTPEHMDTHRNMENYYNAKAEVFRRNNCFHIINTSDPYGRRLYDELDGVQISAGEGDCFAKIDRFFMSKEGIAFRLTVNGEVIDLYASLYGVFNAYNIAFICALLYSEGYAVKDIQYAVNTSLHSPVPGRMERFSIGESDIFVDYAHTPDALEKALLCLREIYSGKIITLFGCGGDRDKTKRSEMGKIASIYSDKVILTEDNSRSEELKDIIGMIYRGCDGDKTEIYPVRKQAVLKGIALLEKGDVLLVAGRGAEEYIVSKSGKVRFSDREFVEYLCREP